MLCIRLRFGCSGNPVKLGIHKPSGIRLNRRPKKEMDRKIDHGLEFVFMMVKYQKI